ncbi:MAG: hypothetical protein A2525_05945 [Sulfurimonas sp. RIFOXYD12_FULL_36_11]|nr:MAG: hypothetical protein A2525_05945 [Sulfurimonas sp. RIFOXYD12_FULL_36_11]OHE16565.1 MAG: hypothetical protein A2540_02955 [Sulfurimonas sp. RIFOXYD2_FULL_37_8]
MLNGIGLYLMQTFPKYLLFRFEGDDFIILSDEQANIDISKIEELLLKVSDILRISVDTFDVKAKEISSLLKFQEILSERNKDIHQ